MKNQLLIVLLMLLLAGQSFAEGTDMYPVSLAQRIDNSVLIAEGTVLSKKSFWNDEHTNIYTSNIVKIHRVLKGSTATQEIEIITEGGQVGFDMHELSATLSLGVGQTGILFCQPHSVAGSENTTLPSYMTYASLQGFIEYDTKDKIAIEPFYTYPSINEAINQVKQRTGTDVRITDNPALQSRAANKTTAAPTISSFTPTSITAGTSSVLTINGTNFGATRGTGYVEFKNGNNGGSGYVQVLTTDYISWSDNQIQVKVPSYSMSGSGPAGTGTIRVTNSDPNTVTSASTLTITYALSNIEYSGSSYMPYHISKNGAGGYTFQMYTGFASSSGAAPFLRALNNWTCATDMNWLVGSTTSTNSAGSDGVNVIRFDIGSELPAGVLGRTTSYYSGFLCNGNFVGTLEGIDMVFDDSPSSTWEYGPSAASATELDFESVVVHELGHAHQINHIIAPGAIMHYAIGAGTNSRVLNSTNDIAAGQYITARCTTSNPCNFSLVTAMACPYTFRTKATGNWNSTSTWQTSSDATNWIDATVTPSGTDASTITVLNSHTVTVTADVNVDETTINSGGIVNVNPGIALTINDGTGTDLTVTGTCTLKSTVVGDARIASSSGTISGNVTVEKYVPGKRAYRFIGHPFSASMALSTLTDDIDITGTGGVTNGFTATQNNAASSYWFNTANANNTTSGTNTGWTAFTSTNGSGNNSWDKNEMLLLFIRGSKGQGLTAAAYTPSATTLDMSGTVNQGNQTISLTKGTNTNFVTCGNPFPSGVQMQNVARGSNVGSNYYVWDATSGSSGAYVTNPWSMSYVLPSYGAFITTVTATDNIIIEEGDKVSGGASLFKPTTMTDWVELTIGDSNLHWDRLLIKLDSNTMTVEDSLDGKKIANPALDFYTISKDSVLLAVDARPYSDSASIPVGLNAYTRYGRYAIRTGMFDIPAHAKLYLHDKYLNTKQELKQGFEYWFDITADTNSQGNNRFEINMSGKPQVIGIASVKSTTVMQLIPNPASNQVKISYDRLNSDGMVSVKSITGQLVYTAKATGNSGSINIPLHNVVPGIYIVELRSRNAHLTQKLVKE